MKLTTREKRLLGVLAVVVVLVGYVYLVLGPQLDSIKDLEKEIESYTSSYEMNMLYEKKVRNMGSEIKIISQRIKDIRVLFPSVINNDEALILVRDISQKAGLEIINITFEEPEGIDTGSDEATSDQEKGKKTEEGTEITDTRLLNTMETLGLVYGEGGITGMQQDKSIPILDGKGYTLRVRLNTTGTSYAIKKFIKYIRANENKMAFDELTIDNGEFGILSASMTISFYGIMDRNAEVHSILKDGQWEPVVLSDNDDMFQPYDGYSVPLSANGGILMGISLDKVKSEDTSGVNLKNYDFSMSVIPYGEDMAPPSISITARRIPTEVAGTKIPVIYGDNKEVEKVEFYLEEKDGKFYCKFKTDHEAFPDDGYKETIEFIPVSDSIRILISSTERKYKGDEGGAGISIINNTTRSVFADVIDEDERTPRIRIDKTEGDVKVNF